MGRKRKTLNQLIENMDEAEQQMLHKQLSATKVKTGGRVNHHFSNKRVKIGILGDMHIGIKGFDPKLTERAFKFWKREGVDAIYSIGDILEGMSGRPGHIYELDQVGFNAQINYAEEMLNKTDLPIYGITGNHDQWYLKKGDAGVDVGEELEARVKNYTYLGMNEADVDIMPGVTMKLFHPNDGSAYAISYKIQKLVESLKESDKPDILFEGHYHKSMYMHNRDVHAYEAGCFCDQSEFMRLKKLPAHKGFWTVDVYSKPRKQGIERVTNTFMPE